MIASSLIITGFQKLRRRVIKGEINARLHQVLHPRKERFRCPICNYWGPFIDFHSRAGLRRHSECPRCGALERHRMQTLVIRQIAATHPLGAMSVLHFAPEAFFTDQFRKLFREYKTADLTMPHVDFRVDLQQLPFENGSYDFVFASHVFEHIPDVSRAAAEVSRILRPGGIAVLPVPIVAERTVEYPTPNPHEHFHWRAPGPDFYDAYRPYFSSVDCLTSASFPEEYQLFLYEDRTIWPTAEVPLHPPMSGERHLDYVPICRK